MKDLNPGIAQTVQWLNEIGFPTCDSGDGETHLYECDRDHAYVVVVAEPEHMAQTADDLLNHLKSRGIAMNPVGETMPYIQADYDPVLGMAFVQIVGVKDSDLFPGSR